MKMFHSKHNPGSWTGGAGVLLEGRVGLRCKGWEC